MPAVPEQMQRVKMAGLDPDKRYVIRELNRIDNRPLAYEVNEIGDGLPVRRRYFYGVVSIC
uniref:Alpha-galactosidase n=1 Tax=feces metagenome TaxID=1861841 RepID=A0A2I2K953_9ZZZZ